MSWSLNSVMTVIIALLPLFGRLGQTKQRPRPEEGSAHPHPPCSPDWAVRPACSRHLVAGLCSSPGRATGAGAQGSRGCAGRGCSGGHCAGRRAAGPVGSCGDRGVKLGEASMQPAWQPPSTCLSHESCGGFPYFSLTRCQNHISNCYGQKRLEPLMPGAVRRKNNPHHHQNHLLSMNISQCFKHMNGWYILSFPFDGREN